jgi:predicted aspartyl protease
MYITRRRNLEISLDFLTYMGKAEEIALVDSGATENCIDYRTVTKLRLGTQKLSKPRPIINVDGTRNSGGIVGHCVHLYVSQGQKEERLKFFVTNLGKDRIILGYPWLEAFNPEINWEKGQIKGPRFKLKTTALVSKEHAEAAIHA